MVADKSVTSICQDAATNDIAGLQSQGSDSVCSTLVNQDCGDLHFWRNHIADTLSGSSNLIAMASNLIAMVSNLIAMDLFRIEFARVGQYD